MYNYPYDDSWINDSEQVYNSDSDIWFGNELKRLSKRCRRVSRNSKKLLAQQTPDSTDGASSKKKSESVDEGTAVKATKPRTSPRLKPEARPRKVFKQEESSVSTLDGLNVNSMKSSYHDHHRYVHTT